MINIVFIVFLFSKQKQLFPSCCAIHQKKRSTINRHAYILEYTLMLLANIASISSDEDAYSLSITELSHNPFVKYPFTEFRISKQTTKVK